MEKAVVYGGGNIGRGFLGQLLFESGFETVFVDVNEALIARLNRTGSYPIHIVSNDGETVVEIGNVRAVSPADAPREIADARILFTSAGVNILPLIAPVLREGLIRGGGHRDIIICENLLHADRYLAELVGDVEQVGFVEASVGRMVPVMTEAQRQEDPARVFVEPFCSLPVDRAAFRNEIPQIRGLLPDEPFEYHIESKLYLHNMGHAVAAYSGLQKGYTYLWESMEDAEISTAVARAMDLSARALSMAFERPLSAVRAYSADLQSRFCNRRLGDTNARIGRDARRKLAPGDRLYGARDLCRRFGFETPDLDRVIEIATGYIDIL